jgi:hypothetical protein
VILLIISTIQLLFFLAMLAVVKPEDMLNKPAKIAMWMLVSLIGLSTLEVVYLLS